MADNEKLDNQRLKNFKNKGRDLEVKRRRAASCAAVLFGVLCDSGPLSAPRGLVTLHSLHLVWRRWSFLWDGRSLAGLGRDAPSWRVRPGPVGWLAPGSPKPPEGE